MGKRGRFGPPPSHLAWPGSAKPGGKHAKKTTVNIFRDRRQEGDRREQSLPIPKRMCRRQDGQDRRINSFNSRPWWLLVNYNDEFNQSL